MTPAEVPTQERRANGRAGSGTNTAKEKEGETMGKEGQKKGKEGVREVGRVLFASLGSALLGPSTNVAGSWRGTLVLLGMSPQTGAFLLLQRGKEACVTR